MMFLKIFMGIRVCLILGYGFCKTYFFRFDDKSYAVYVGVGSLAYFHKDVFV